MAEINLVRDVLDNQLVDREGRKMGRVDGIVAEPREGKPPRLAYIEVGWPTLACRLHPRLGDWVAALGRKLGDQRGESFRIAWRDVRDIGINVEVVLNAEATPALAWEMWLRKYIIDRIPGSG